MSQTKSTFGPVEVLIVMILIAALLMFLKSCTGRIP